MVRMPWMLVAVAAVAGGEVVRTWGWWVEQAARQGAPVDLLVREWLVRAVVLGVGQASHPVRVERVAPVGPGLWAMAAQAGWARRALVEEEVVVAMEPMVPPAVAVAVAVAAS
jgi:hypothetical protein